MQTKWKTNRNKIKRIRMDWKIRLVRGAMAPRHRLLGYTLLKHRSRSICIVKYFCQNGFSYRKKRINSCNVIASWKLGATLTKSSFQSLIKSYIFLFLFLFFNRNVFQCKKNEKSKQKWNNKQTENEKDQSVFCFWQKQTYE